MGNQTVRNLCGMGNGCIRNLTDWICDCVAFGWIDHETDSMKCHKRKKFDCAIHWCPKNWMT